MAKSDTTANHGITNLLINGRPITIQNIVEINIFEGLSNPAVTGRALLADREAILEKRELIAGDTIEIEFQSKAKQTKPFSYKGIITSAGGKVALDKSYPVTEINFCSEWWFKAISKQVSKAYKNVTWEEIITDLVEVECGGSYAGAFPAPMNLIERFVIPYWTPAHAISFLLSGAHADPLQTGYTMYENINGKGTVFSLSTEYLYSRNWNIHKSPLVMGSKNKIYEGTFNDITMESYFDTLKYSNQGVYQTDYISFDYDQTKVYKSTKTIDKLDLYHLSGSSPIPQKHATEEYKSTQTHWGPFHQQERKTPKEFKNYIDGVRNDRYCNLYSDMVKFNVLTPGATDRVVGQFVKIEFPSINTKEDQTERHKFLEGYYLIRNINHIFRNDIYSQAMTVCLDGFGSLERSSELLKWTGKVLTGDS